MQSGDKLEKYRLLQQIGVGGMGEVWKAVDEGITGREVAIKVVRGGEDRGYLEALASEARTLAQTPHHPNVVILYDVLELTDQLALVMEYIPGITLSSLISNNPNGLPWDIVCLVFQGLFAGVGHAHKNKVIHRDLKPDNVRIANFLPGKPFGSHDIKILDFGLARVEKEFGTRFTRSAAGTLIYMSPEQIKEEPQGPFTDVYALGIILYEALLGKPPFGGPGQHSFSDLIRAHCEIPPPPLSMRRRGIEGPLEEAILRSLAKNPAERFPSAVEMGQVILPLIQRNVENPTISSGQRYKETVDLNEIERHATSNISGPAASPPKQKESFTRKLSQTAVGSESPIPVEFRIDYLKWGKFFFLGVLVVTSGIWVYKSKSPRASTPNVLLDIQLIPKVCEIKGYSYETINPLNGQKKTTELKTFQLGSNHVTIKEFRYFVKTTGYDAGIEWDRVGKDDHPVTSVNYKDASAYVSWLSKMTGDYWYIPSEEEYEFAATGRGHQITYPWGDVVKLGNIQMQNSGAPQTIDNSIPTMPVGSFPPNELGLNDMIGNAWIWTSTNKEGGFNILKGGSWFEPPGEVKISTFLKRLQTLRDPRIGFRVAKR